MSDAVVLKMLQRNHKNNPKSRLKAQVDSTMLQTSAYHLSLNKQQKH